MVTVPSAAARMGVPAGAAISVPLWYVSSAVAALLRAGISGSEYITLEEELELIGRYLAIQEVRFGDRFVCELDVDERFQHCVVPKLVLQPLVENAIIHGTADGRCITITVESRFKGTDIELLLRDNGCGFDMGGSAEKAAERFSGIGLSNVDQRLYLHYGKGYGLQVTSSPNTGTCCRILLPQRIWKEESNGVSGSAG